MLGSIFVGLSGLNAYSLGLRQVSNNITNLNSTGFKASAVSFSDSFSSDNGNLVFSGGDGLSGNGVSLSGSRLDFSQGEIRQTDRDLDLAIEGDGFLVLENNGDFFYARTGSFEVDSDGFIVLSGTDYRLTALDQNGEPQALNIDPFRSNPPEATTRIEFADNLSSTADDFTIPNIEVFNAEGEAANWTVEFSRPEDGAPGEWTVTVTDGDGNEIGVETLRFNNGEIDPETAVLSFSDADGERSVELDFSENVTSFSSGQVSTLRTADVNGFGIGEITGITVDENGQFSLSYSNEQTQELGAVTIANFSDSQSLEQRSGGLFVHQGGGNRTFVGSDDARVGRVLSRRLEASNVDLSQQFGDLILVQRGFQASSQVVSISNEMIQQLFGIRGQG